MVGFVASRRRVLGMSGAVLGGFLAGRAAAAQEATAPPVEIVTTDGIAGGGTLTNAGNDVPFSLAVFARAQEGGEPVVQGTFRLIDRSVPGDPVVIESEFFNSISAFSTEAPDARRIQGWARANGNGPFPFLLQVEDVGSRGPARTPSTSSSVTRRCRSSAGKPRTATAAGSPTVSAATSLRATWRCLRWGREGCRPPSSRSRGTTLRRRCPVTPL